MQTEKFNVTVTWTEGTNPFSQTFEIDATDAGDANRQAIARVSTERIGANIRHVNAIRVDAEPKGIRVVK